MSTVRTDADTGVRSPQHILRSVLAALSAGKISELVVDFDDHFKFTDHALGLDFTDKARLIEFFARARELFPDTQVEVVSIFECQDTAIAEWKLTAMQTVPYGSISYRFPILLPGSTIVQIENGKNHTVVRLLRPEHVPLSQFGCIFYRVD